MMNSLFLKNTSKGAEERRDRGGRRDGGTVGGREEVLHSKSSRDLSLAGEGIWEKKEPRSKAEREAGEAEGGREEEKLNPLCYYVIWWGASSISMRKVSMGVSPMSLKKNKCSRHLRPMERSAGNRSNSLANLSQHRTENETRGPGQQHYIWQDEGGMGRWSSGKTNIDTSTVCSCLVEDWEDGINYISIYWQSVL